MQVRLKQIRVREAVLLEAVEEGRGRQLQLGQREVHDALETRRDLAATRVRADRDVGVVRDGDALVRLVLVLAEVLVEQVVKALIDALRLR